MTNSTHRPRSAHARRSASRMSPAVCESNVLPPRRRAEGRDRSPAPAPAPRVAPPRRRVDGAGGWPLTQPDLLEQRGRGGAGHPAPARRATRRLFSAAVRNGTRLPSCRTTPIRRARSRDRRRSDSAARSVPSNSMRPASGSSRPAISATSVDFPAPDGPSRQVICPRCSIQVQVGQHGGALRPRSVGLPDAGQSQQRGRPGRRRHGDGVSDGVTAGVDAVVVGAGRARP